MQKAQLDMPMRGSRVEDGTETGIKRGFEGFKRCIIVWVNGRHLYKSPCTLGVLAESLQSIYPWLGSVHRRIYQIHLLHYETKGFEH